MGKNYMVKEKEKNNDDNKKDNKRKFSHCPN